MAAIITIIIKRKKSASNSWKFSPDSRSISLWNRRGEGRGGVERRRNPRGTLEGVLILPHVQQNGCRLASDDGGRRRWWIDQGGHWARRRLAVKRGHLRGHCGATVCVPLCVSLLSGKKRKASRYTRYESPMRNGLYSRDGYVYARPSECARIVAYAYIYIYRGKKGRKKKFFDLFFVSSISPFFIFFSYYINYYCYDYDIV